MSNAFEIRILLPAHKDDLLAFAKTQIEEPDEMEREMHAWTARWRGEALDHYLPQGWSFGAFDGGEKIQGFLLAQPYLFHRGLTQTLWVEQFNFANLNVAHALLDTAYRWARDKHFQCVLIEERPEIQSLLRDWRQAHPVEQTLVELRSARF